jgi:radical SAM superfamily enzyme YgiQ (UPF0313 family)
VRPLLLIPPLTQLNTPYPATAYLCGLLKQQGISFRQGDLGLDLVLRVFNREGFKQLFDAIEQGNFNLPQHLSDTLLRRDAYEATIDTVIDFLQNKNYSFAYRIANSDYLPQGNRFKTIDDLEWFFGHIGVQDKARYKCTMYLEDVADLIQATVGPHFGFSKYAERIARTAVSFDPIEEALQAPNNYFDALLVSELSNYFAQEVPDFVGFTVPFGGNLYGALKCAQWIKQHHPHVPIAMGGGYPNTELRDLYDPRVFNYIDYITLDDGEGPLMALFDNLRHPSGAEGNDSQSPGSRAEPREAEPREAEPKKAHYIRTFIRENDKVVYKNNRIGGDYSHKQLPAPTYEGLRLKEYLSVIDMPNPMHRLWNDGRWNKLTVAHGCYWKKCSFCDISLDYISRFEQSPATALVDKMEQLIAETGETGFHLVDEAAPPLALRDMALEILRRGLQVSWWGNIRFEKTFTPDLCSLLAASGCIAVTGGLEVASPRLLELMEKGVTIDQVARVCKGFRDAGILVHAYLMYGFPTQTDQETIDSLEIVRMLFEQGLLHSAHWHQFAMTAHSPVGLNPEKYGVIRTGPEFKGFANNDLYHEDPQGANHEQYSEGLKKALYNYMHGHGFNLPLQKFFSFKVPKPRVHPLTIVNAIKNNLPDPIETPGYSVFWQGESMNVLQKNSTEVELLITLKRGHVKIKIPVVVYEYFKAHASNMLLENKGMSLASVLQELASITHSDPEIIVRSDWWKNVRSALWVIKFSD